MIAMRLAMRSILGVSAVMLLMTLVSIPSASAESPWWHLNSGSRPTNLQPGLAKNEVQHLTVTGSIGETFVVLNITSQEAKEIEQGEKEAPAFAELAVGDSAGAVQADLETVYGAGNVEVAGGPGEPIGSEPYIVTFKGALADQLVRPMNTELSALFGFAGEAKVTQAALGRPDGQIVVMATNLGDKSTSGPVTITDKLPAGLTAVSIEGFAGARTGELANRGPVECSLSTLSCTFSNALPPYYPIEILIGVEVGASPTAPNEARVSGGEASSVLVRRHVVVSGEPAGFGVENYELTPEEEGGVLATQAGSHPFQLTTTLTLNQDLEQSEGLIPRPVELAKDLNFKWPPGLIGNPSPIPRCSLGQFLQTVNEVSEFVSACPPQTAVGVARTLVRLTGPISGKGTVFQAVVPLFNLEPAVGEPARFGFRVTQTPVFIDPSVRSGGDYGITVHVENIAQTVGFVSSEVTVWGVPGDSRHDDARGYGCLTKSLGVTPKLPCNPLAASHPPSFLSLPRSCTGSPLKSTVEGDSWLQKEPRSITQLASTTLPALDGCNALPFSPSIEVTPDTTTASTPMGLNVDVHVPQDESVNPNGLAESDPRNITVALPEGVAVNPSGGDGLQACSEGLVGFTGFAEPELQPGVNTAIFTPKLPKPLEPGANFCPDASKIATAKIKTPILPSPLEGAVYLATQNENPFGSLLAMYIVVEDHESGVVVKLAGEVHLTDSGQLVTTFKNSPQAPFEDAELHFFGGERAPLASPARCGAYATNALFTPWSAEPGEAPRTASSTFNITSGPNGAPCPGATLPFSPSLAGGTTNVQAGKLSPLTTTIGREDGQQDLRSVQLHIPPGLSGLLSSVKLCPEQQANEGTCPPESLIGETTVSAGVGSDPVSVKGGRVYITGKYAGAPFGLSIVNPVKAGPFDLEHDTSNPNQQPLCDCVVVRAKIEVDPHTAALTVTTDPSGPHAIPHLIDGIPVQIKRVNVTVNRPGFTFNPTNCNPLSLAGTITSYEGASQALSTPFQVHDCGLLAFKPGFKVSTSGRTSKANGASLSVKLTYPKAPFGSQANISRVKVNLPKQLPSRLTTLQKACTAAQFEANPAGCPPASLIGHAKAITPLLPVPLEGPAYFVSHGGEAFPSLIMVLQGYGVTVDLVGTTFINKAGITSSTFKTVPDAPVGSFEVTLPQGKFSALAANGNLCKSASKLRMPTEFVAQNGAVIKRNTKIAVTGCPKHKTKHAKKAGKHKKHKKGQHGKK